MPEFQPPAAPTRPFAPALLAVVLACAALSMAAWYPGMMSYDSLNIWAMSLSGNWSNAHPPVYTALVHGLRQVADTPAMVLGFNIFMFSVGSLFLGETLRRQNAAVGLLLPLVIFLPFVTNFIGILWKDTALAVCWWAAAGVGLYAAGPARGWSRRARRVLVLCACLLFVLGIASRHNAIFAGPFLLSALLLAAWWPRSVLRAVLLLGLSGALSLGAIFGTNALIDSVHPVKKIHMVNDLYLYDLAGISKQTQRNAFAAQLSAEELEKALGCYRLTDWNSYAHPELCLFVMNKHYDQGWYEGDKLAEFWLDSVLEHPAAYAQHRMAVFGSLLRLGESRSYGARYQGIDPNELGLSHPEHLLYRGFQAYVKAFEHSFLMKPWFWLVANVAAIALLLARRRAFYIQTTLVAGSGLVYLATYLPFGIASDFRYVYWTIFATLFAWSVIVAGWKAAPVQSAGHRNGAAALSV